MMRGLWIALSTLALANLMALGAFAMWLNSSGRLSRDRVEKVREIFAQTVAQESALVAAKEQEAEAAKKQGEEKARDKRPPITAEQRLEIIREYEETQRQKSERLQRETRDLLNQLDIRRAEFDRERAAFVAERQAFAAMREELARNTSSEQFAKSLKVYESVKAADAASMLSVLMQGSVGMGGSSGGAGTTGEATGGSGGKDQVVAYLNAMQPRVSSRIIAEFNKKDPILAADLLERLRTYGFKTGDSPVKDQRADERPASPTPAAGPASQGQGASAQPAR